VSSILLIGFLLGMRHALESDHVAAVASLASRSTSLRQAVLQGAIWGLGHTVTLFVACSAVLFLDRAIPEHVADGLEAAVGLMLVALGLDVLRRLRRDRIHFHVHHHGDGTVHLHAHSHLGETRHDPLRHRHAHPEGFPLRALCVGMVHGLAGSAALLLLAVESAVAPAVGLVYVALFGVGSVAGMALLSAMIAVPLQWSARSFDWLHNGLQSAVGVVTIALGALLVYENAAGARLLVS
jgi:ABC-type nickel/cobalt efflux system permease component RcnA